jgi:hypothetical protein
VVLDADAKKFSFGGASDMVENQRGNLSVLERRLDASAHLTGPKLLLIVFILGHSPSDCVRNDSALSVITYSSTLIET